MSDPRLDRLAHILDRARKRAALLASVKAKSKVKSKDEQIAEDYAERLAEKHRFRQLLEDIRLDGMRFRWYFQHIDKSTNLDQLRGWIDNKIAEEAIRDKQILATHHPAVVPAVGAARPTSAG